MRKGCAATVIISMGERKNHGTARIRSYTRMGCAKTVISINIIKKGEKRRIMTIKTANLNSNKRNKNKNE